MKTLIICLMFLTGNIIARELPGEKPNFTELPSNALWVKSDAGMWMASYKVWYKMDKKTSTIKCSYNKRKWKPAENAVWHDVHGKWYCIADNKMMSSEDGKKWEEVANRTWQDINGAWFKFDNDFLLYEVVQQ